MNQSKLEASLREKARENVRVRATIWFGLTSDWMKNGARFFLTNH